MRIALEQSKRILKNKTCKELFRKKKSGQILLGETNDKINSNNHKIEKWIPYDCYQTQRGFTAKKK